MGLDITKLEKLTRHGSFITARCPACAELGGDNEGKHLFVAGDGRFGCVLYPGERGREHRRRIFTLASGQNTPRVVDKYFEVRRPSAADGKTIQEDILGRLGRLFSTYADMEEKGPIHTRHTYKGLEIPVPSVPGPEDRNDKKSFSEAEEALVAGLDGESLEVIRMVKDLFGATVISSDDIREEETMRGKDSEFRVRKDM